MSVRREDDDGGEPGRETTRPVERRSDGDPVSGPAAFDRVVSDNKRLARLCALVVVLGGVIAGLGILAPDLLLGVLNVLVKRP
jgi:hypothetical protein